MQEDHTEQLRSLQIIENHTEHMTSDKTYTCAADALLTSKIGKLEGQAKSAPYEVIEVPMGQMRSSPYGTHEGPPT